MANKNKNIAYDFDGVASEGIFEDGAVIITGRSADDNDEILEILGDKKASAIYNFPDSEETDENSRDVKVGIWKAKTIKKLGIEKFYEDSEAQIQIIQELNTNLCIVKVVDGVPQEKLNFVIFTYDMTILPIAHKLEKEGNRVILGVIEDKKQILLPDEEFKPENPDKKKQRLSIYDGMMDKYSADEVLKIMKRIKDKENWIVLTDSNSNYKYTEKMLELGFTKGIFPLQIDREMECDRKKAKDFVKENYKDIKVAEVKSFKEISEGIEFLNQSEELWVLKSAGDAGDTICPNTEDGEIARDEIISALEEMKNEYEQNGFILEPRILEPIELTPEIIFNDGLPLTTSLDIEIKNIGAGSAIQTGCVMNLVVKTMLEDRINKIAFPEIVYEMAKERKGLFVWDLSILIDKKGTMYFGEYCSQRFGWDSFPTELAMSADDEGSKVITPFFSSLLYKKNPLRNKYGIAVRMLNIGSGGKMIDGGTVEVKSEAEPYSFLYEVKCDGDKMVSTTSGYDFGLVATANDELYEAIDKCYEYLEMIMFEGKYFRAKFDMMSHDYSASILRRLDYATSFGFIDNNDDETIGRELPTSNTKI